MPDKVVLAEVFDDGDLTVPSQWRCFRSVISIPPVVNRLVLFSPGILHRINPFEGERFSVAVNIWEQAPLTTTAAESPA